MSVLENYHATQASHYILDPKLSIFSHLDGTLVSDLRTMVVAFILGTDSKTHKRQLSTLLQVSESLLACLR